MKTLNTSFNQVRMDSRVSEYSTYPNAIAVNEKNSGSIKGHNSFTNRLYMR